MRPHSSGNTKSTAAAASAGRRCKNQLQSQEEKKSLSHMPLIQDSDHKDNSDEDELTGYYDEYRGPSQEADKLRGRHAPLKMAAIGTP